MPSNRPTTSALGSYFGLRIGRPLRAPDNIVTVNRQATANAVRWSHEGFTWIPKIMDCFLFQTGVIVMAPDMPSGHGPDPP